MQGNRIFTSDRKRQGPCPCLTDRKFISLQFLLDVNKTHSVLWFCASFRVISCVSNVKIAMRLLFVRAYRERQNFKKISVYASFRKLSKQASKHVFGSRLFLTKGANYLLPHQEKAESGTILTIGQSINQSTNHQTFHMSVADEAIDIQFSL